MWEAGQGAQYSRTVGLPVEEDAYPELSDSGERNLGEMLWGHLDERDSPSSGVLSDMVATGKLHPRIFEFCGIPAGEGDASSDQPTDMVAEMLGVRETIREWWEFYVNFFCTMGTIFSLRAARKYRSPSPELYIASHRQGDQIAFLHRFLHALPTPKKRVNCFRIT